MVFVRQACVLAAALAVAGCMAPQPLCGRPEVLAEVGRVIRIENIYNKIDPNTVAEGPTARADFVVCSIIVNSVGYVPTAAGWVPQPVQERHRYSVSVADNRFTVAVLP